MRSSKAQASLERFGFGKLKLDEVKKTMPLLRKQALLKIRIAAQMTSVIVSHSSLLLLFSNTAVY